MKAKQYDTSWMEGKRWYAPWKLNNPNYRWVRRNGELKLEKIKQYRVKDSDFPEPKPE